MPWHPPCALSNLIVTNLSSCQRIDFSIFVSFFLLRPTAKLSHFTALRALFLTHSQLVSLQDVFPSGCAVFKVQFRPSRFARWLPARIFQIPCASRFAFAHPSFRFDFTRSLKTIQVQEDRQSFDHYCGFSFIQPFGCHTDFSVYRPGMNLRVSSLILSLERR